MSNEDREAIEYTINRLDRVEAELQKLRRALIAQLNGEEFNEEFDDEISGVTNDLAELRIDVIFIMLYIFKIRFASDGVYFNNPNYYKNEYEKWVEDYINIHLWLSIYSFYEPDTNKPTPRTTALQSEIESIYEDAIELFYSHTKNVPMFVYDKADIPDKCPWSVIDLIDKDLDELVKSI